MNKFEPKSIRYRGEAQKPFADCSNFPKVDFSKFDFPVEIIESPMDIRVEKEMFSAIKRVGVKVDKEELLRALNFERDQYTAGYRDGFEAAQPKWISVEERLPEDDQCVMYFDDGEIAFRIVRGWALRELCEFPEHREVHRVTHWMPLPEPPKEE